MKASLILPCFKRWQFLDICLKSISLQQIDYDLEIIVLNDYLSDNTIKVCKKYRKELNIKYIFTGQRNLKGELIRRVPGFAINIGVKQSKGDIIILSCPGILHLNNAINSVIEPLLINEKILSTTKSIYFDKKEVINYLMNKYPAIPNKLSNKIFFNLSLDERSKRASEYPYFMGMYKKEFLDIGGYDEDFTGFAGDDDDLMDRLKLNGLSFYFGEAQVIHLHHGREEGHDTSKPLQNPAWVYNNKLRLERKGIIIRNKNKTWGDINE